MKKELIERGMKLMQDPRVMKLMSDPRVMKAMMSAFQARTKVSENIDAQAAKLAKTFNLATKEDLRDLKKTVRKLEDTIKKLEKERDKLKAQAAGSSS
ncbi:MAG: hypothetical protein IT379_10090 [Deltaproteobacteria bacterium]|nr:hypothetical protein [Deltaproteobacteria bacterium]